eukprot:COSAG01_NODE_54212_length_333_cov_1.555556_2_plen_47_part_01
MGRRLILLRRRGQLTEVHLHLHSISGVGGGAQAGERLPLEVVWRSIS